MGLLIEAIIDWISVGILNRMNFWILLALCFAIIALILVLLLL